MKLPALLSLLPFAWTLLAPPAAAQGPTPTDGPAPYPPAEWRGAAADYRPGAPARELAAVAARGTPVVFDRVLFDEPGDGRIWSRGSNYKVAFGADGCTYVPFLGADEPKNHPVQFAVRTVTAGGQKLALGEPVATRRDDVVTIARGIVREHYEVRLDAIEQTIVLDAPAGDIEVELAVTTDLAAAAGTESIRFVHSRGHVDYGRAFLIGTDGERIAIASDWNGSAIVLRVPGAARRGERVVIDPIITTQTTAVDLMSVMTPDIAYDVGSQQWMAVYEVPFSAADHDVIGEFRADDGTMVPNSRVPVDVSSIYHGSPRVANSNYDDRFLVVMERIDPAFQNRSGIIGRSRDANSLLMSGQFYISDERISSNYYMPDVGGDSGNQPGSHGWCVVYIRHRSATTHDVYYTIVDSATLALTTRSSFRAATGEIHSHVQVANSNGAGLVTPAQWMLAYSQQVTPTDWDIYYGCVSLSGQVTRPHTPLATGPTNDLFPSVSSPIYDPNLGQSQLITWERQGPYRSYAVRLDFFVPVHFADLSAIGFGGFWVRAESDGDRFVVVSGAADIHVGTLSIEPTGWYVDDMSTALPGIASFPRIASKRASGGGRVDCAIAYTDNSPEPDTLAVSLYEARQDGASVEVLTAGCNNLSLRSSGRPFRGEPFALGMSGVNNEPCGIVLGTPMAPSTALCAPCPIGIDLTQPIDVMFGVRNVDLVTPRDRAFLGLQVGVQGFALGSGPCIAQARFSDALRITIR